MKSLVATILLTFILIAGLYFQFMEWGFGEKWSSIICFILGGFIAAGSENLFHDEVFYNKKKDYCKSRFDSEEKK